MCAAIGRATSVGLSVLIGIEREAAIELAGGKRTTGVVVHASVCSQQPSDGGQSHPLACDYRASGAGADKALW